MEQNQPKQPKPRGTNTRKEPPAWYKRLVVLGISEDRDVRPHDFDADLSELGKDELSDTDSSGAGFYCECDNEEECECQPPDCDDRSASEESYDGSDAGYYYELKMDRTQRKRDILHEIECQQLEKQSVRDYDQALEQEVYKAYEAMQQERKTAHVPWPKLDSIVGKSYRLHSVDHVDYCYNSELYGSKYVEFYYYDEDGEYCKPPSNETEVIGHVYFNVDSGCDFDPFRPPQQTGREKHQLKTSDTDCIVTCQFISNKYWILSVDRRLVARDIRGSKMTSAPKVFTFVGICDDPEDRKRRREEGNEKKRKRQSTSPSCW